MSSYVFFSPTIGTVSHFLTSPHTGWFFFILLCWWDECCLSQADTTLFAFCMRLIVAFVIQFFTSCDCVKFALDSYSLRKLTVAFHACVKYVYRRRLFDHISNVSDSILGYSLLTLHIFGSLVFSRSQRTLRINSPIFFTFIDFLWLKK
jgi:hypothetical protein